MSKTVVAVLAGVAGFAAGLYVARLYAQGRVNNSVASLFAAVGITNPTAVGVGQAVANSQVFGN